MPQPIPAILITASDFKPGTTTKQAAALLRRINLHLIQDGLVMIAVRIH